MGEEDAKDPPADALEAYYSDYEKGGSLFSLPFKFTIEHPWTWSFLLYMIMFMIVVDTCQRVVTRFSEGDRCKAMFAGRVISELMMFGAVAITILLIDEAMGKSMPYMSLLYESTSGVEARTDEPAHRRAATRGGPNRMC